MKLIKAAAAGLIVAFALAIPATASATNETVTSDFDMQPKSGSTFFNNAFSSAKWSVETTVSTPDPTILPMKVADLGFPNNKQMTFNPKNSMPVCPDSQVGPPPANMSEPVPNVVARCPDSVIGNGTAQFALAKSTALLRDGVMVVFNGGKRNGLPLIKVYAYSYDTQVGIYTEAVLAKNGRLKFDIPQLTADSAVTQLNLAIPSEEIVLTNWGPGLETVVLPAGIDKDYVQAKCATGSWDYRAVFSLGERDTAGDPVGPTVDFPVTGQTACQGITGKGRVANIKVKLKNSRVKAGRNAKIGLTVRNGGNATLKRVVVKMKTNNRFVKVPRKVVFKNIKPGGKNSKSKRVTARIQRKAKGSKVAIVARAGNQKGKLKLFVR